jgi:hypothetical protein
MAHLVSWRCADLPGLNVNRIDCDSLAVPAYSAASLPFSLLVILQRLITACFAALALRSIKALFRDALPQPNQVYLFTLHSLIGCGWIGSVLYLFIHFSEEPFPCYVKTYRRVRVPIPIPLSRAAARQIVALARDDLPSSRSKSGKTWPPFWSTRSTMLSPQIAN